MQTRKRAKSVTFGKKVKEKEKEAVKEEVEEKAVAAEPEKTKEKEPEQTEIKSEPKEEKKAEKEPVSSELSSSLPKTEEKEEKEEKEDKKEEKEEASPVTTPENEFVTESPLSATPESPKPAESSAAGAQDNQPAEGESPLSGEQPKPIESPTQPAGETASAQPQEPQSGGDHELSSTPPQSAFTIQSNEPQAPAAPAAEGKKKFGLYFIIIALLSFVLGLGAIAAANYFGLIKLSIPQLPVAAQPTPTTMPVAKPTVAPTAAKVDLSAYTISVLNGSTIAGQAAKVQSSLTSAGYKVGTIGNADKSSYTKTEIAAKSTVSKAYITKLQDELKKSFVVDTTVGTLPASATSDVTVTLGSQTAQ